MNDEQKETLNRACIEHIGKPFARCTEGDLVDALVVVEAECIMRDAYIEHLHERIRLAREAGWAE